MIFYNGWGSLLLIFVEKKINECKRQTGMGPMRIAVDIRAFVGADKTHSKFRSNSKSSKNGSDKNTRSVREGGFSL